MSLVLDGYPRLAAAPNPVAAAALPSRNRERSGASKKPAQFEQFGERDQGSGKCAGGDPLLFLLRHTEFNLADQSDHGFHG